VVILDGGSRDRHPSMDPTLGTDGVTFLDLTGWPGEPNATTLELRVDGGRLGRVQKDSIAHLGAPDRMDGPVAEFVAHQLAALDTVAPPQGESAFAGALGLPDLRGVGDPRTLDPAVTWRPRSARDRLRIPIGVDPDGRSVGLDLKESAEAGMGP